jgi:predicted oxidoreductase
VGACEASLKRLGTDCIDLLQIHRPDLLAHPAEVASAFESLKRAGKIRAAGVSNYSAAQTASLLAYLPFPLASIQPEFSALAIEPLGDGVLDLALQHGLAVLAWSPLAQGRLLGAPQEPRAAAVAAALDRIAVRAGVSRSAAACAWVMQHPSRPVPLLGTQTPERLRELGAAQGLALARAEWYGVLEAARGRPMP